MCGIWGIIQKAIADKGDFKEYLMKYFMEITERGPDFHQLKNVHSDVVLGFHRLAIMDPTPAGNQPFTYEDDDVKMTVVCNGEIYNWEELRDKYELKLKSNCDCEILLPLFKLKGKKMFEELVGVFAMVIFKLDKHTDQWEVIMCRDRFGVRPMFLGIDEGRIGFCSEMKGLVELFPYVKPFPPRKIISFTDDLVMTQEPYYTLFVSKYLSDESFVLPKIREKLIDAVRCRIHADRPICTLLSGGLDSSLVTALVAREVYEGREEQKSTKERFKLHTYSIGMPGAVDHYYADLVAKHIDKKYGKHVEVFHDEVVLTKEDFLKSIPNVIKTTESFDVTTVRASTGQYLISKWIAEKTDNKVIFIGDGADEVCVGYLMFKQAPSLDALQKANLKLVNDIHFYDVLRADRGISENGLEARVPFLDHRFVDFYISIDPKLKEQTTERMEKFLLRKAFEDEDLLPPEVLWRRKEAFSDGVSSQKEGWFQMIQKMVNEMFTDKELAEVQKQVKHLPPPTKEALYFRWIFRDVFKCKDWDQYANNIPYFWTPIFEKKDKFGFYEPSARALDNYHKEE